MLENEMLCSISVRSLFGDIFKANTVLPNMKAFFQHFGQKIGTSKLVMGAYDYVI